MTPFYNNAEDGETVALQVIGWIVSDARRSERFLTLTGLDADQIRWGLQEPAILGAAMDYLLGHEQDLLACAEAIEVPPQAIAVARQAIG